MVGADLGRIGVFENEVVAGGEIQGLANLTVHESGYCAVCGCTLEGCSPSVLSSGGQCRAGSFVEAELEDGVSCLDCVNCGLEEVGVGFLETGDEAASIEYRDGGAWLALPAYGIAVLTGIDR